ncbi:hypothetical protein [Tenacibaculum maritimum]|uniref:hypothetical protein n=1 Tax=Tenacibaculum maritimum TaxID=107401 RepID=UPI0012E53BD8|nr:hypothetical protein [Tenacibaculum maritimum]MCD9582978.1 hypothetical protein [Tenacibaculum maritimum]MCD9637211.1 hypothetical protein [Tenacibaculum maritimum]CAA0166724.1 hypothetical protein TMP445_160007 [Tenacibaculum maritimum]CAA0173355.1 hypothetical protein UCDSB2_150015 [Tenacibaculum maritimum]CAA0192403.1 hypothetical protein USCSE301_250006 [Tenacibaculum maritimum]
MNNLSEIGKKYSFDISMSGEHYMLCELSLILSKKAGGLGLKYLQEIIFNLELVLTSEIEEYEFGFDSTIIDFKKEKSIINFNYFEDEIEVDSMPLYQMMNDWLKAQYEIS